MKWTYLILWGLVAAKELPEAWQVSRWKGAALWLLLAGAGLALAVWFYWGNTDWRLAEWALEIARK